VNEGLDAAVPCGDLGLAGLLIGGEGGLLATCGLPLRCPIRLLPRLGLLTLSCRGRSLSGSLLPALTLLLALDLSYHCSEP
jgi:hypothetical protein